MKAESEKMKSRTSLSMNEAEWKTVQRAVKIENVPLSQFIRQTLVAGAESVIEHKARTAKKKGGE